MHKLQTQLHALAANDSLRPQEQVWRCFHGYLPQNAPVNGGKKKFKMRHVVVNDVKAERFIIIQGMKSHTQLQSTRYKFNMQG